MLEGWPSVALVAAFLAAGSVVALAGSRLSRLAASLSDRTRLGSALVGALFLGAATSLPEIATTVTATRVGATDLAVGNLLGGVAAQLAILAVADAAAPGAISGQALRRPLLLQSAFLAVLLGLALGGSLLPSPSLFGMGPWSLGILLAYPLMLLALRRLPVPEPDEPRPEVGGGLRDLAWRAAAVAGAILVAGATLVLLADELAGRFDLEASFVGATAVALSTSLPEISTAVASARLGRPTLAFSNILGANLLQASLIGAVDAVTLGPPILAGAGAVVVGLALLGLLLTATYAAGSLWRRQPSLGRLGLDSWFVAAAYLGGMSWLATW